MARKTSMPLRFAHPFYTTTPIEERPVYAKAGKRLTDHIKGKLHPVPTTRGNGRMSLSDILGSQGASEIEKQGVLRFHATGDTGRKPGSPEEMVSDAMKADYDISNPGKSPAFFLHLGDVVYGHDKDQNYRREFYEPYMHYPGKIIAIPGNHDGEIFPKTDPVSLKAFLQNFCSVNAKVPAIAGSIYRETMTQPGVYWLLETPFVDIIGLDSNSAENPGYISGKIPGSRQKDWFSASLKYIKFQRKPGSRKGLIFVTHHPPYCAGGHSGSNEMISEIDGICKGTGIFPDLFLSGHAHSYQRYMRKQTIDGQVRQVPFIVAGTGGVGEQSVPEANGQITGEVEFVKSYKGYGFLLVSAKMSLIEAEFFGVDDKTGKRTSQDIFRIQI